MTPPMTSYLLFVSMIAMVMGLDLGAGTPMEKAFQTVRNHHMARLFSRHRRDTGIDFEDVPCLTLSSLTALKERFVRWLDNNNDGLSTFEEVKEYLRKFKPSVKDDAVEAFIHRRDTNGNDAIDFVPEYVHDISTDDYTLEGATEWFHIQDANDDGFVDEKELVKQSEALGMSPQDAISMVQGYYMPADIDKDGKLTFDEFKTLYNQ